MRPVLYRYKDTESVVKAMDGYTPGEGWTPLYDQAAMDAATNAALERAALEVEKMDKENWFAWQCAFAKHSAEAIRALKEES